MTDLNQKVFWITGASSGIGRALAVEAAKNPCAIILSGRREGALKDLADELPVDCLVLPFEVTDYPQLTEIVDRAWAWQGQ